MTPSLPLSFNKALRTLPNLFALFTREDRRLIERSLQWTDYERGDIIYAEGTSPDRLLCVARGKVKVYRDGIGGRSQIMRLLGPQQYFGYRAAIAEEPYATAAAAFEEASIISFTMETLQTIMQTNNSVSRFFLRELATDLGIADRRTVSLTQKHVRGRIAESLLYLKRIYGTSQETGELLVQLTREDIANLSNMTTSNAIRTISAFAHEGLVAVNGKTITIINEPLLAEISSMG